MSLLSHHSGSGVPPRIAVIGAGVSGARCAQGLAQAGLSVVVFDKSRGVGGRLATRRQTWNPTPLAASDEVTAFDHGAPGFTARSDAFRAFMDRGHTEGWLAPWRPVIARNSYRPLDQLTLWVPVPAAPALCRHLIGDLPLVLNCPIDALSRTPQTGWRLHRQDDGWIDDHFDSVVLALPPAQAAPLLHPHHPQWAQQSARTPMQACWTLIGVADARAPADTPPWDAAWPEDGPLNWIARDETKPGRQRVPGRIHWVAQANAAWSQTHLEDPAQAIQTALQTALSTYLKRPVHWHHATVHRWRYASALRADKPGLSRCWWDASGGLGVCGDYLGGAGVEGAWLSGQALASAIAAEWPAPSRNPPH